jgi:hypothetical protein
MFSSIFCSCSRSLRRLPRSRRRAARRGRPASRGRGARGPGDVRRRGDAYVKLAEMPGVNRRSELDKAHTNYDSAYLATQNPSRLCWALRIAEQVVREGEFNDADQASYWRDTVDDDLRRLQADARTNPAGQLPLRQERVARARPRRHADRRRLRRAGPDRRPGRDPPGSIAPPPDRNDGAGAAQTASGAVLGPRAGVGRRIRGCARVQAQHARAMRRMTARRRPRARDFTDASGSNFNNIRDDGRQLRNAAIGVGVAGVITLSAGVALLATRKRRAASSPSNPTAARLGAERSFGALLRR